MVTDTASCCSDWQYQGPTEVFYHQPNMSKTFFETPFMTSSDAGIQTSRSQQGKEAGLQILKRYLFRTKIMPQHFPKPKFMLLGSRNWLRKPRSSSAWTILMWYGSLTSTRHGEKPGKNRETEEKWLLILEGSAHTSFANLYEFVVL